MFDQFAPRCLFAIFVATLTFPAECQRFGLVRWAGSVYISRFGTGAYSIGPWSLHMSRSRFGADFGTVYITKFGLDRGPIKIWSRPTGPNIGLYIRIHPVWSESSLSAWRKLGSLATHWVHSEDSDQTGRCPGWSVSLLGAHAILLVLSRGGANVLARDALICTTNNLSVYRKSPKILDPWRSAVITLKVEQDGFSLE